MLRLVRFLIAAVAAAYLVVFAVQNRGLVDVVLWPGFVPLTVSIWMLVLAALVIGVVLSGIVIWLSGMRWRSEANRAQRVLRSQEVRRQLAEQREEERAAAAAAARRAAAEADAKERSNTPALAPTTGTKSLALPAS
ncbi:MAG: lipopolysaccharide assembly protein LapA domain-containing protein [Pseudomonadota bacterium]